MTSPLLSREAVGDALRRRGITLNPDDFFGVLDDAIGTTATLTIGEQDFLLGAGVAPTEFSPQAVQQARHDLALLVEQSEVQATKGLSTREVADMLGTQPANVRRLLASRGLYASGRASRAEHVFPVWQFVNKRPLPHLADVLTALPSDMHPLDVEAFMLESREPLGDRSPRAWLSAGGRPEPVMELALEDARI